MVLYNYIFLAIHESKIEKLVKARTVLIAQRTDHYQNTLFEEEDHIFMFWQVEQRECIL